MHPDLAASLVSTLFHWTPLNLLAINSSELCLQLCCLLSLTSTSLLIPRPHNSLLNRIHCCACMPTKSILYCIHRVSLDGENCHWTASGALSTGRSTDQWDSIVTTAARCRLSATRFGNMCDTLDMRSTLPGHNGTLFGGEIGKSGFHGVRCERWSKRKACSAILKQSCRANHRNAGSHRRRAAGILLTPRASRNNGRPNSRQPSTSPSSETAPPDDAPPRHDASPRQPHDASPRQPHDASPRQSHDASPRQPGDAPPQPPAGVLRSVTDQAPASVRMYSLWLLPKLLTSPAP
jgi:hypothetical protein